MTSLLLMGLFLGIARADFLPTYRDDDTQPTMDEETGRFGVISV